MTQNPSVTFYGGVDSVTGANFLLEAEGMRALIDCGMFQGTPLSEIKNKEKFPYDPTSIDALFITHAHIDHTGRIPELVRDGFKGVIYSTAETKVISELMLSNSANIMESRARREGVLAPYSKAEVSKAFSLWKTIPYHTPTVIGSNLKVELKDAGHILGSSMYIFEISINENKKEKIKILFTGDLGNSPSTLLPDTEFVQDVNYIVMDSVYGDRNHESKELREARFKEIILDAIKKKGVVVIPAFSLERTQDILYTLNNLIEDKIIPSIPVFLDSPLAIEVTEVYEKITSLYNDSVKGEIANGDKIFEFPKFIKTVKVEDSKKIHNAPDPKIIIAGSGMSTAGRVLHHETRYLPDPNATILLMGYQALGTLGRDLQEGIKEVSIFDKKLKVRANIENIQGYSAHKDSDNLLRFVEKSAEGPLKEVFVVMGEPKSALFLVQKLRDNLGINAIYPQSGKTYNLSI